MRPTPIAPTLIRLLGAFSPKTLEGTMVGKLMAAAAPIFRKFLRVSFIAPPSLAGEG
jgi:hypothetical protein